MTRYEVSTRLIKREITEQQDLKYIYLSINIHTHEKIVSERQQMNVQTSLTAPIYKQQSIHSFVAANSGVGGGRGDACEYSSAGLCSWGFFRGKGIVHLYFFPDTVLVLA